MKKNPPQKWGVFYTYEYGYTQYKSGGYNSNGKVQKQEGGSKDHHV